MKNLSGIIPQYHIIQEDLRDGRCIQLEGCVPSQTEHLLSTLKAEHGFMVVICRDELHVSEFIGNYLAFDREVYDYPALDPVFAGADIRGSFLTQQRTEVLHRILDDRSCTIATTLDAFAEDLRSLSEIRREIIEVRTGASLDREDLASRLVKYGYEHESQVTGHGEFSIRGSIIDIFPYASDAPYRVDLFGDEVDSIRTFDTQSQRSSGQAEAFLIYPAAEQNGEGAGAAESGGLLDYFREKDALFIVCEPARIIRKKTEDAALSEDADEIQQAVRILQELTKRPGILLSSFGETLKGLQPYRTIRIHARNIESYNGRFLDLVRDLKIRRQNGYHVILECASQSRMENMIRHLAEEGIFAGVVEADPARQIPASEILVRVGRARIGFEYPEEKFALITEVDVYGEKKAKKRKRRYSGDPIREFTDLNIGDYVVHEQHGVGIYQGIERIRLEGVEKDYMKIGYAQNASLYVLATQFDKIQKYGAAEGAKPKLSRLGGKEWTSTRERVRAAVQDIARDLVALYAARQTQQGFCYSPDTVWQKEFEDSFIYEETDDQLHAIQDVKADMESGKIMDRLICGDVGFGKTEIAIRAAFKAVQDGKQVAFLTPTTILAQQHYHTLIRRLEHYPVTVRMLSRFLSASASSAIRKELLSGQCDIVVGTHKLLGKDVKFKDLGLLIVDEEQRFGVSHKEKIKQLKKNVDVITLSATPIPRTLHMSLTGIRDMSVLTQPPVDRLPIQTYVMEYSDEAVKEAIMRETARGGQVYYVYNRTRNIDLVASGIQQMLPHLRVAYAHGKMAVRELEDIMFDFIDRRIDVLVSTTIIETGLDIPNVNTIIIHDADNFGLSQLYQLRGRVGRSNRTAYAFLMYKRDKLLREVAEKRLKAIREFSDLGSGIRIAMRDLEIRGAGNVLGAEQSGHMEAVGYELYCKMLNDAVLTLKGESVREDFETTIDVDVDGYIPDTYIPDESEKLNMYKRISAIADQDDLDELHMELEDRFGKVPAVTENLMSVAYIKARAHECFLTEITQTQAQPVSVDKSDPRRKHTPVAYKATLLSPLPEKSYDRMALKALPVKYPQIRRVDHEKNYILFQPERPPKNIREIQETLIRFFDILATASNR